jgi:hypothetical protein
MNKDMKKAGFQSIHITLALAVLVIAAFSSCEKNIARQFYPSRMFTPTGITISGGDTAVKISWPRSLNAPPHVNYTVEINTDSSFKAAPVLSLTVDTIAVIVTDDTLQDRQRYFARVRANAPGGDSSSYWMTDTVAFSLIGVQIFKPISSADVIDNKAILHWKSSPGVSLIVVTPAGGDTTHVAVTAADNQAGQKLITNLTPGTAYTVQIFAGHKSKGLLTFTTKEPVTGPNVIDLRDKTDPNVLADTLDDIPSGSTVLLARGMTYDFADTYVIDKTVTIKSGLGFGTPATLSLASNLDASGDIDSIRFDDVIFAANGSNYFMNISQPVTIGKISIVNCSSRGQFSNSFIRMKKNPDHVGLLYINNCVLDSFGVESKYAFIYANASSDAYFDKIEIQNSTFYYFYYFIRQDKVSTSSVLINNCTFDNMINQGGYFLKYTNYPTSININHSILGKTLDPTDANGIESSAGASIFQCYITSDCVFSANPIMGASSYSGSSYDLFVDPDQGNFHFKDAGFSGKNTSGDPRWR